jgi:ATP-dependent Lhr-like helicase
VEGQAMRGRFSTPSTGEEWCDRRLLARIHRYTLKTLRRGVEPVSPAAYMRFLFRWHQVGGESVQKPAGLSAALGRLIAFPLPAAAWEGNVLPARDPDFGPAALDQVLAGGEFLWLRPSAEGAGRHRLGPMRTTPILFLARQHLEVWQSLLPAVTPTPAAKRSAAAAQVHDALRTHGAIFFVDLLRLGGLERNAAEAGLRELIAAGLVNGDGYAGLRTLLLPSARRRAPEWRRQGNENLPGRWSLVMPQLAPLPGAGDDPKRRRAAVEHVALTLLDRYGVVFRSVLQREARFLPPWRELAQAWRRLEARGKIRGGRFVASFGGEQFALPEAIDYLRGVRHAGNQDVEVVVSAADPLNLSGIVTPGDKVPALLRNRVHYRNGIPVGAWLRGDYVHLAGAPTGIGDMPHFGQASREFLTR